MKWLRENWLRVYLATAPLGTMLVTWLLLYFVGSGRWWSSRENLELAGQTTPWGGVIYGTAILLLEVSARMLWTLVTRDRDMEKSRKEGREETIKDLEELLTEMGVENLPEILKNLEDRQRRRQENGHR